MVFALKLLASQLAPAKAGEEINLSSDIFANVSTECFSSNFANIFILTESLSQNVAEVFNLILSWYNRSLFSVFAIASFPQFPRP